MTRKQQGGAPLRSNEVYILSRYHCHCAGIELRVLLLPSCQNLNARFSDSRTKGVSLRWNRTVRGPSQQSLFELSASLSIYGGGGPIIRPMDSIPIRAEVDHLIQYISAPALRELRDSYRLNGEALIGGNESVLCHHHRSRLWYTPFLASWCQQPYSWRNVGC